MKNLITSLAILAMSAMGANAQSLECSAKIGDRITTTDVSELESALKLYAKKLDLKKDEFETTVAFKERLKRAEDSVGFKNHFVSIVPIEPEILNIIAPYNADQEIFNIFNSAWSGGIHRDLNRAYDIKENYEYGIGRVYRNPSKSEETKDNNGFDIKHTTSELDQYIVQDAITSSRHFSLVSDEKGNIQIKVPLSEARNFRANMQFSVEIYPQYPFYDAPVPFTVSYNVENSINKTIIHTHRFFGITRCGLILDEKGVVRVLVPVDRSPRN